MEQSPHASQLTVKSLGIDTYLENNIYIRSDSHISRSEGFSAITRVVVQHKSKSIVSSLNVVHSDMLRENEAGLSDIALRRLNAKNGDIITVSHLKPIEYKK